MFAGGRGEELFSKFGAVAAAAVEEDYGGCVWMAGLGGLDVSHFTRGILRKNRRC